MHDYSFSVSVPLHLPKGTLSKDQQEELISQVRREAQEVANDFIKSLEMSRNAVVGDGYVLYPDHYLHCIHPHEENPSARQIMYWAKKPTKEEVRDAVEYHYDRLHRRAD